MTASGVVTSLASFDGLNGRGPTTKLAQTPDGRFFGTTEFGGLDNKGTIFQLTPDGFLSTVVSFNQSNGSYPRAGLAVSSSGALYGTTYLGGLSDRGTVFKLTPPNQLVTLVHCQENKGSFPWGGLMMGADGNFYGTTLRAPNGNGSVFKMTPSGDLSTLATLTGDHGGDPKGTLIQDSEGNFYGTSSYWGPNGLGAVFKVTPPGVITRLVAFGAATTGSGTSSSGLVRGIDGNFYGTTLLEGGSGSSGTIFKLTPAGELTVLQNFPKNRAGAPYSGLTVAGDGQIYGTLAGGSDSIGGSVFSMSHEGIIKTLATFDGIQRAKPKSGLTLGRDGNYYGVTPDGGKNGFGMIYSMTPAGEVTTLASFDGITAAAPKGPPTVGPDGDLYGTADQLVIWRLAFPPVQSKAATLITATGALLHGAVNPKNQGAVPAGFQFGTDPTLAGASTLTAGSVPNGGMASPISASLTNLQAGTVYYYRATAGAASSQTGNILSFQTLTTLQSWRLLHFGSTTDSGDAASAADPDRDGLANLMEFAVGSHPKTASPSPIRMQHGPAGLELNYSRHKQATAVGLLYTVEWSDDLNPADWSSAGVVQTSIQDWATEEQFKALVPSGGGRRFVRLRVSLP